MMNADYIVIDWGLGGHEIPYILGTVKALLRISTRIMVAVPDDLVGTTHYEILERELSLLSSVQLRTFCFDRSNIRPRRFQSVINIFRTSLNIRRQLGVIPRMGYVFTTLNGNWHPKVATSLYLLHMRWAGCLLHPIMEGDQLAVATVSQLGEMSRCSGLGLTFDSLQVSSEVPSAIHSKFFLHPDVVNLSAPDAISTNLTPTVTMIGSINRYKDIDLFINVAECNEDYKFQVIGKIVESQFTSQEIHNFKSKFAYLDIKHVDAFVPDGSEFNRFILESDYVWTAYTGFAYSSNVQQKANAFGIPTIVPKQGVLHSRRKPTDVIGIPGLLLPITKVPSLKEAVEHARGVEERQVSSLTMTYERIFT